MTQSAEPDTPEPVSDDDATAAADDLAAAIANERDLHRQSDTKAIGAFAAVGLIIAATSTTLPHLDGGRLQVMLYGLTLTVASGIILGITLIPRYTPRRFASADQAEQYALNRVRRPHDRLRQHAEELSGLEDLTRIKHRLVRAGLVLLGVGAQLIGWTAYTLF
jgi:hypothetical protein